MLRRLLTGYTTLLSQLSLMSEFEAKLTMLDLRNCLYTVEKATNEQWVVIIKLNENVFNTEFTGVDLAECVNRAFEFYMGAVESDKD